MTTCRKPARPLEKRVQRVVMDVLRMLPPRPSFTFQINLRDACSPRKQLRSSTGSDGSWWPDDGLSHIEAVEFPSKSRMHAPVAWEAGHNLHQG